MSQNNTTERGSYRCPECGRLYEKVADRQGKDSPQSDFVYSHETEETSVGTSYRDHCFSDRPPEAPA